MNWFFVFITCLLVYQPCTSRSVDEEQSVVSVYTTLPTTAGTGAPLDVYRQIADNIAERITQPIFRFFGFNNQNHTTGEKTTKRPFEHIEIGSPELDLPKAGKDEPNSSATGSNVTTGNNNIPDRDVEELSLDSVQKSDKKPEKFVLYSAYLPVKENLELNDTNFTTNGNKNETNDSKTIYEDIDDNSLELDDVDRDDDDVTETAREGPFAYILELIGSIIQLLWGGFMALFNPPSNNNS